MKRYRKIQHKIKYLVESENNGTGDHGGKYMNDAVIIIRSDFYDDNNKCYQWVEWVEWSE